jgi:hypothetical protein
MRRVDGEAGEAFTAVPALATVDIGADGQNEKESNAFGRHT